MKLKLLLPAEVLLEEEVTKVIAEAENGSFCLSPRHIDFVAALVPGILSFVSLDGREEFVAVDEGTLVKCGSEVLVSTRNAVRSQNLGELKDAVEQQFRKLDEREKMARSVLARLEAVTVRQFAKLGEGSRG